MFRTRSERECVCERERERVSRGDGSHEDIDRSLPYVHRLSLTGHLLYWQSVRNKFEI